MMSVPTPPLPDQLTLSSEAFPVKTSAPQASKRASRKALGLACSTNSCESFAQWDRNSSSWKTSQLSLLTGLEPFLESWPRQGMTRNGRAYRRQLWAPAISGIGGGVLPTPRTPTTHDYRRRGTNSDQRGLSNIEDWVLPTPQARDHRIGSGPDTERWKRKQREGWSMNLNDAVLALPTPAARDHKDCGSSWNFQKAADKKRLAGAVNRECQSQTGDALYLNPSFVEEMMGFPIEHTALGP